MHTFDIKQLFVILLALFLVVISTLLYQFQTLKYSDNIFYDLQSAKIRKPIDDNIVIIAIDDISLNKLGPWPWSRAIHAKMLERLTAVDVKAIGIDVLFIGPDTSYPEDDVLLSKAISQNNNIVIPALTIVQKNGTFVSKPAFNVVGGDQLGHVNLHYDDDGIVRKLNIRMELDNGQTVPSMALALSQKINQKVKFAELISQQPTLITFANPTNQFRQLSYSEVFLNPSLQLSLQGKTVLIGITVSKLSTLINTPVSKNQLLISAIEFQANALSAIQLGQTIRPISWTNYGLMSLLVIFIPVTLYQYLRRSVALLITLGFIILTIAISFYLLSNLNLWAAPSPILFCLLLSYPLWTFQKLQRKHKLLSKEHENASATIHAIEAAVITTDKHDLIEFMNPAAQRMFVYSIEQAKKKQFTDLFRNVESESNRLFTSKEQQGDTRTIRNHRNEEFTIRITRNPVFSEKGSQLGYVYVLDDLTHLISINKRVAFLATHDTLTGLANRSLIQDLMKQAIKSASREGLNVAILFIDLDGFKDINDTLGHDSGDLLLQEVAKRLKNCVRQSDTCARWGGDEFIILLDQLTHASDASEVATKIKTALAKAINMNKKEVFITPSIGISLCPIDGDSVDMLLSRADAAMYNVKMNGKNDFCFYSANLEFEAKEKLMLEAELRKALLSEEFEIFYQPQFDIISNHLVGIEALIRWHHPKKGILLPGDFIPLAEETGLIIPIGEWLIKTLCQQLKSWQQLNLPSIQVAINLSIRQFFQKNLIITLTQEIKKANIRSNSIRIEINESMMINDISRVIYTMNNFETAGIPIAVDNYGIGYSSLEYLKRLPIDIIKIDRSFIRNILQNKDDGIIVQTVIAMAHNLNIKIIAEGVETMEQLKFLKKNNCNYAQGYLFSRPVSAQDMEMTLITFKSRESVIDGEVFTD